MVKANQDGYASVGRSTPCPQRPSGCLATSLHMYQQTQRRGSVVLQVFRRQPYILRIPCQTAQHSPSHPPRAGSSPGVQNDSNPPSKLEPTLISKHNRGVHHSTAFRSSVACPTIVEPLPSTLQTEASAPEAAALSPQFAERCADKRASPCVSPERQSHMLSGSDSNMNCAYRPNRLTRSERGACLLNSMWRQSVDEFPHRRSKRRSHDLGMTALALRRPQSTVRNSVNLARGLYCVQVLEVGNCIVCSQSAKVMNRCLGLVRREFITKTNI